MKIDTNTLIWAAVIIAVVALRVFRRITNEKQRHATIRAMIDKGVPIPPEILRWPNRGRSDLRRGLVWMAIGIGLMLYFVIRKTDDTTWAIGLIPLLIGAACLLFWALDGKNNDKK